MLWCSVNSYTFQCDHDCFFYSLLYCNSLLIFYLRVPTGGCFFLCSAAFKNDSNWAVDCIYFNGMAYSHGTNPCIVSFPLLHMPSGNAYIMLCSKSALLSIITRLAQFQNQITCSHKRLELHEWTRLKGYCLLQIVAWCGLVPTLIHFNDAIQVCLCSTCVLNGKETREMYIKKFHLNCIR